MSKKEKHLNAKQRAYEKKQEEQGRKVVNWIFAILVLMAVLYLIFTVTSMS